MSTWWARSLRLVAALFVLAIGVAAVPSEVHAAPAGAAGPDNPSKLSQFAAHMGANYDNFDGRGAGGSVRRVIIVSIPGLGFDDLTPHAMPNLAALADRGATAALSVKTIGRRTDRADGYATIGAGSRATAPNTPRTSGRALTERLRSGQTVGDEIIDRGRDLFGPQRFSIVVPDIEAVTDDNRNTHQGAVVGALGSAMTAHGWQTAVIANHDGATRKDRVAALAIVRSTGRRFVSPAWGLVDRGSVSPTLTDAPSGRPRRTDGRAVAAAVARLPERHVAALVEIGDVAWSQDAGERPSERREAVARADRVLGQVAAHFSRTDLVVAVAPNAPSGREQPTPFVLAGPGVRPGSASSATTRRAGYVTLPDVAPTILRAIGSPIPSSISGTPISSRASDTTGHQRLAALRAAIAETRFIDRATGVFLVTLPIVFASWSLLALLAAVLPLGSATPIARGLVRWLGIILALVSIVTYLLGAVSVRTWGQPAWSGAAWSLAAVLAAVAWFLRPPARGVVAVASLIWGVLVIDLVSGGALQFATVLGNSPTVAGRFSGIGNNAFGLLAASTLILAVAAWERVGRRHPGGPAVAAGGAVFAVAILVDGAPGLGSDVGGILTLAPVAALTLWSLSGRRISWAKVAVAGVGTVLMVGLFTAVDLTRPESSQTHLGRLARRLTDGGGADLFQRKGLAALNSFRDSSLVWIPICTALLAGLLWLFGRPPLRTAMAVPHARTVVRAALALGVLGAALNDSGVMVPAMMASVFVPVVLHLLLSPGWPSDTP